MDTAKVKGNDTTIFSCNSLSGIFYLFIQHSLLVLSLGCMFWHISMALFTVQRVKLFLKSLQASLFLACLSSLVVPPEAISVWRLRTTGKPLCVCGNNMRRMTSHLTLRSPGLAHFFQTSFHGNIPENWNSLIVVILLLFCTELVINLVRTLVVKLTNWKTRKVLLSAICLAILNALSQRLIFSKFHNSSVFPSLGNVLLQSHCSCSCSKNIMNSQGRHICSRTLQCLQWGNPVLIQMLWSFPNYQLPRSSTNPGGSWGRFMVVVFGVRFMMSHFPPSVFFIFFFSFFLFCAMVVYLFSRRERETEHKRERGREREGDTESRAVSRLWAVSPEPDERLKLITHEITTWAEVRHLPDCATQVPLIPLFS